MRLMHARTLLFRQLQQFFEQHLMPRWRISDVVFSDPVMAPKVRGIRQRPREIVIGNFGDYTIEIRSTVEEPPLGKIILSDIHGNTAEGPIDEVTWRKAAAVVVQEKVMQNGY